MKNKSEYDEDERKIKKYSNKISNARKVVLTGLVFSLLPVSTIFFTKPELPNPIQGYGKTNVIQEYDKAKITLETLKLTHDNLAYGFPYKNEEIQFILNKDGSQTSKLEEAMGIVKKDIPQMKKDSEYAAVYDDKKFKRTKNILLGMIPGLLVALYGGMKFVANLGLRDALKDKYGPI